MSSYTRTIELNFNRRPVMRPLFVVSIALLQMIIVVGESHGQGASSVIEGPLLGQTPPGSTPEVFAPGIVNTEGAVEIEGMFATDMTEFYFMRRAGGIETRELVLLRMEGNRWIESVVQQGEGEPSISPDGTIIYFKNRYMERTGEGWSESQSLGPPFDDIDIMRLSASIGGTVYFDTYSENLDVPLRYSRLVHGAYETPRSLGDQFGVGRYNAHPFIAPDESYIIWDSIRDCGFGASDLYISFRMPDGSWGPAQNMGDQINTADAENYPSVSPDGKYLFFDRRINSNGEIDVDIFWVETDVIATFQHELSNTQP